MYIMAILFLLLSLLGIFVQIFTLQTAQMFANQKAIGQTMLTWHNGAVGFLRANPTTTTVLAPCSLRNLPPASMGGFVPCATTMKKANTSGATPPAFLPAEYNFDDYQWFTLVYTVDGGAGQNIVTFVPPAALASDRLIEEPNIGITMGDLFGQLRRLKIPQISYGYVTTVAGVQVLTNSTNHQYTLPNIPSGSLAIVSSR